MSFSASCVTVRSGEYRILRRLGAVVPYTVDKYKTAMVRYFLATSGKCDQTSAVSRPGSAKAKADAGSSASMGAESGSGGSNGGGGGDGDGDGDGDGGDSDGPRPSRPRNPSLPASTPPRAHRRLILPTPLTRQAFAWLLVLALLLAYIWLCCTNRSVQHGTRGVGKLLE